MWERTMSKRHYRNLLCAGLILSTVAAPGCGKAQQPADKAAKIVERFLDAWSRGEPPDKFAGTDGPIQGADPDWKAGHKLLSFLTAEMTPSPETPDRIRCRVALSLQDQKGKRWDKEVVYDVQMGKKSVISRVPP
jgi:hypothetical protein